MAELTLREVARLAGGNLRGDGETVVRGVAPLESAGRTDLSFVASPRYLPYLQSTRAGAVLTTEALADAVPAHVAQIRIADPHAALAGILPVLYPEEPGEDRVHPTAVVEEDVEFGEGVSLGAHATIGRGARIGARTRIGAHSVVGVHATVGSDCVLHSQVTLYRNVQVGNRCILHSGVRLGADGFGFVFQDGEHRKIPQVGGCRIEDDVEIGANSTVDRGSIGDTVVGKGSKIDNLVHVGHNVILGQHVIVLAQTGIAGSTRVGDGSVLAGQSGIGGHLVIGAGARVGAQAGVMGDVPPGESVSGYPARPHREAMRAYAALFRLPELIRKLRRLEEAVFGANRQDSRVPADDGEERPESG
ncbi:MAG TPA: UDP-3-O-(3-hydroxymyristoyl)glucosamine N-acyltransferase [Longimicrobiaceae bacterium]|nr:UDP-3-O-(3-hydroxymyristoyl)glucosamine N-acyltransferase [Longimicrobiaceae bacterium]